MSSPFIGEIRMFGGNFAPVGWAFCDGALMAIDQNDALFNLIGTTYGGDGQTTFALPDLQSRVPVHVGPGYSLGQRAGVEQVTLTASQIPAHTHPGQANSGAATAANPAGNLWASGTTTPFSGQPAASQVQPAPIQTTGGSQPHDHMLPFL